MNPGLNTYGPESNPWSGGLWVLILKILDLFEFLLDYFVTVAVQFGYEGPEGQWYLMHIHSEPTDKGIAIMDALVTIIHYGLVFVAQFVVLLPASAGTAVGNLQ